MDPHHERLSLSEREQSALAELEALIADSDPEFSRRLDGSRPPPRTPSRWLGAVLTGTGAIIMLFAFTTNVWFAAAGAALMAVGLALALPYLAAAGSRRRRRRSPHSDGT